MVERIAPVDTSKLVQEKTPFHSPNPSGYKDLKEMVKRKKKEKKSMCLQQILPMLSKDQSNPREFKWGEVV